MLPLVQLSRIVLIIRALTPKSSPSFVQHLSSQFPRWHIIGTLLRYDAQRQQTLPAGMSKSALETIGKKVPPPDSNFWDHIAWQLFASLQAECFDLGKMCARRSCGSNGVQKCTMCQKVQYCGETCQKKCVFSPPLPVCHVVARFVNRDLHRDSKSHDLVCGWMPVLLDSMEGKRETTSLVEELPMDSWR
jgi:hypothetical protein